jgi:hypothetical protein
LSSFVHVTDPGKDTFIYVIERGVLLSITDASASMYEVFDYCSNLGQSEGSEFRPPGDLPERMTVFQSQLSRKAKEDPFEDDNRNKNGEKTGHGTAVASKALGSKHGVAKKVSQYQSHMHLATRCYHTQHFLLQPDNFYLS